MSFDVDAFRAQFPFFAIEQWAYLDNAATTQKPRVVLDAQREHLIHANANVHRSAYPLALKATQAYEAARATVAEFIGAEKQNLVFTRGATEALNIVASGLGQQLQAGDCVLVSEQEHHANIVPWQFACQRSGATLETLKVDAQGLLQLDELAQTLARTEVKVLAITHVSNVLGVENPIAAICAMAAQHGVVTVVDGAQAVAHFPVDVQALGCDAYVFSGHKMFGPDGIGALYLSDTLAEQLPPFLGGGEMIAHVSMQESRFKAAPYKFEAGTPPVSAAVGLAAAVRFLRGYRAAAGEYTFASYVASLMTRLREGLAALPLEALNDGAHGILSVVPQVKNSTQPTQIDANTLAGIGTFDAFDVAQLLGEQQTCVRAGQHCAEPLLAAMGHRACLRISLAPYNTMAECEQVIAQCAQALELLA